MDPIEELNDKLVKIIKDLNKLLIKNPKVKEFSKKYNFRILNELDPNGLISEALREIYKAYKLIEENKIGAYLFEVSMLKDILEVYNGFHKDITRGTQIDFFPNSLGYYSFLYYLYRYIVVYCGRILKYTYGMRSLTYKFVQDILEKPNGTSDDVMHLVKFFYMIVMELDGSNNSPLILVSNKPLHKELKLVPLDSECFNYLKEYTLVDKALIKDNFKIHHHYVQNYVAISTTNAGEIATKAIKHLEPQTVKLNTFLTRRTDKHNTNNRNNSRTTKKTRIAGKRKKTKSKNRKKSIKKRK